MNSRQPKKKSDLSAANLNGKASGFQVKCYDRPTMVERQRVTWKSFCGHCELSEFTKQCKQTVYLVASNNLD